MLPLVNLNLLQGACEIKIQMDGWTDRWTSHHSHCIGAFCNIKDISKEQQNTLRLPHITWVSLSHGIIDEFAGLQQDVNLFLWRIGLVHGCEFVQDFLQHCGFRHTSCDSQVSGSCTLYDLLVFLQEHEGSILAVDFPQVGINGLFQRLQDTLVQSCLNNHLQNRGNKMKRGICKNSPYGTGRHAHLQSLDTHSQNLITSFICLSTYQKYENISQSQTQKISTL